MIRDALRRQMDEDLRLAALQVLAEAGEGPTRALPVRLLRHGLAALGHKPSAARFKSALAWLAELDLVQLPRARHETSPRLVDLTERGLDVARGLASEPGVARPGPDDGG